MFAFESKNRRLVGDTLFCIDDDAAAAAGALIFSELLRVGAVTVLGVKWRPRLVAEDTPPPVCVEGDDEPRGFGVAYTC